MDEEKEVTRRDFLANAAMAVGLAASFGYAAYHGVRFMVPPKRKPRKMDVLIASVSELPEGSSMEFIYGGGKKGILINVSGEIRAFSKVCTHLNCEVEWQPDKKRFFCPCHEGIFDENGRNIAGPPPRPLDRFEVKVEDGNIFVRIVEV